MDSSIKTDKMVDIVTRIYSKIVKDLSSLSTEIFVEDDSIIVSISASEEDVGRIIGHKGASIKALRNILVSYALVNDDKRKIFIEVITNN